MDLATRNPEFIKAELRTRFGSCFRFEDEQGLPRKSVSDFLRGRPNKRVSDAIAKVLSSDPQSDKSDSSRRGVSHRLNAEAR